MILILAPLFPKTFYRQFLRIVHKLQVCNCGSLASKVMLSKGVKCTRMLAKKGQEVKLVILLAILILIIAAIFIFNVYKKIL